MESVVITVCIYIRCDGDVAVAHEFFCHIDGNAGLLQIGAEGMAQTVEGEIFGNGVLDDLVPIKGGAHVNVQLAEEGAPVTVHIVIVHDGAILFGKDEGERISLLLQKQRAESGLMGMSRTPAFVFGPFRSREPLSFAERIWISFRLKSTSAQVRAADSPGRMPV